MRELMEQYLRLILEENQRQNLVSRRAGIDELFIHVEDSLVLTRLISLQGLKVVDLGSGAGFPAIPLACVARDAEFTLIESDQGRIRFLNKCIKTLELKNVCVYPGRAEVAGREDSLREKADVVTARGVTELRVILEWGMPLLKVEGCMAAWKGPGLQQELQAAGNAFKELGGIPYKIEKYAIDGKTRSVLLVKKIESTPDKYPRRTGIARKRPL